MDLQLIAIKYTDYRNIKRGQTLTLEEITALIGANESGKSNLLDSVLYLRPENKISPIDATIGSERYSENKPPLFEFFLKPSKNLINEFRKYVRNLKTDWLIVLIREGDEYSFKFVDSTKQPQSPKLSTVWVNSSPGPIEVTLRGGQSVTVNQNEEIVGSAENALSLARLKKKNLIQKIEDQTLLERFKKIALDNLPNIVKWEYEEQSYYIKDEVPWSEFLAEEGKFQSNERLFELAAEKFPAAKEYRGKLNSFGANTRKVADYLDKVGLALNEVIKETWNQSNIQIRLENRENKLEVSIFDGGPRIPPSIRSEGLKWFISFLLEFRSQGGFLANYIFLLDQPGDKLHPGGQKELVRRFEDISNNNQIIYATQSPFMVNRNYWNRIQFLKSEDGSSEVRQPTGIDIRNDELLRQVLGYTLADVGQANEWNVITEGYWDKIIFRWHATRVNEETGATPFDFNKISIFDAEGGKSIKPRVDELIQSGLNAVGVFDGDPKITIEKAREDSKLKERFFSIDEVAGADFLTGEDFIPADLYLKAVEHLVERKITATRTKNHLPKQPRLHKLENYLKRTKKGPLTKEGKEKLWLFVEDNLETFRYEETDSATKDAANQLIEHCLEQLDRLSKR